MHAFHHDVGIVNQTGERPGEHPLLPLDVGGVDVDNNSGVGAGDVRYLIFKWAFGELGASVFNLKHCYPLQ